MVPQTKSNARSRAARSSVADAGAGTTCVGTPAASPICRPIILCGSSSEQADRKPRKCARHNFAKKCVRHNFSGLSVLLVGSPGVRTTCRDHLEILFLTSRLI